ncbi:phytoene desaturase family protein [Rhodococcus tibetensis]|uniref:NAD(P)/FAD-dependent oxidoreductase n=1 Tax=Rhodococcus tibetensis TaxID=2965064 RepID=A0ABT1QAH9_9NOCA|nr:NAD(P)/FAD-dependent oxidoreductase [Rhodococcus sp. FXJ9.536]MCQ4118135.1 NAD(P)/FAD-dependent oxidoreductase [Rhodococcus sp. FXJ9.536]
MTSRKPSGNAWDTIVIGAGLGGLTTAAYLAANGQRVLVVEQYDVLGGSSHVFRRKRQWEFEVGVHYIEDAGPGGMMPHVLEGLGLADRVEFLPLDPNGFDTIIGPDVELRTPRGWDAYRDNLVAAFPTERRAIGRYLALAQAAARAGNRTAPAFGSAPRMLAAAGIAAPFFFMPYAAVLVACGLSPRAILTLCAQSGAYTSTPDAAPFGMHVSYMADGISRGAWFPRGGGQVLSANLYQFLTAHGGQVRTNTVVEKILTESGRVAGVRLVGGEVLRAPVVVSDADIKRTYLELLDPEVLPRHVAMRAQHFKMGWPLMNTYFGLELDLRGTTNTNYYVIPSWEKAANLYRLTRYAPDLISRAHKRPRKDWVDDFSDNMAAFIHSGTVRDPENPRTAPPGCASVEAMTMVPRDPALWGIEKYGDFDRGYRREPVYRDLKSRLTDVMLDRIDRAYPGARAQVLWSEAASPATQTRYTRSSGGSSFGLAVRPSQYGPTRPGSRTAIPGLFLAGTSTRWGPGTTGAMLSGVKAAGAILSRDLDAEIHAGAVYGDASRLKPLDDDWDPLAASRRIGKNGAATEPEDDADPVVLGTHRA